MGLYNGIICMCGLHVCILYIQTVMFIDLYNIIFISYIEFYIVIFFLKVGRVDNINHCLNFIFSVTGKQKEDSVALFSSPF